MILPTVLTQVSIELIEFHFDKFIMDFQRENNVDVRRQSIPFAEARIRHHIFVSSRRIPPESEYIGEVEIYSITDERVEIRSAALESGFAKNFFDCFFDMVFKRWDFEIISDPGTPGFVWDPMSEIKIFDQTNRYLVQKYRLEEVMAIEPPQKHSDNDKPTGSYYDLSELTREKRKEIKRVAEKRGTVTKEQLDKYFFALDQRLHPVWIPPQDSQSLKNKKSVKPNPEEISRIAGDKNQVSDLANINERRGPTQLTQKIGEVVKKTKKTPEIQNKTIKKLLELVDYREENRNSRGVVNSFYNSCNVSKIDPKTAKKYIENYDPDLLENWDKRQYSGQKFIDAFIESDNRVEEEYYEITGKRS